MPGRRRPFLCTGAALLLLATAVAAEAAPRHVLLLYSYEREFSHFTFARLFRPALARSSPDAIDFIELSLQTVRGSRSQSDAAILENLHSMLGGRRLDLVVTIGGPAAAFSQKHHAELFGQTPILFAAFDSRFLQSGALSPGGTAVMVRHEPVQLLESMLRLLPDTRNVLVVIGASKVEQFWLELVKREFRRFEPRVTFTWTNQLSLAEMLTRAGSLPPHSAIFYAILSMDATGTPQMELPVLDALHEAANAPMFGLHSHQLGHGIVGGPLLSLDDVSRDVTAVALRLLQGEPPGLIQARTLVAGTPTFDSRELRRWGIPHARLPAASAIAFGEAPAWRRQGVIAALTAVAVVQTAIVIGLAVALRRRRARPLPQPAGWDVNSAEAALTRLTHRLMQAREEERASIARAIQDDVCQQLVGLTLRLQAIGEGPDGPGGEQRARIQELCDQFAGLQREIFAISDPLYPQLRIGGLVASARLICERRCAAHGLRLHFRSGTVFPRVPETVALALFRVLEEALDNVVAHARASHVTVALEERDNGIELEVADDGVGFDPEAAIRGTAVGLVAIRERLRQAGGSWQFDSRPGSGTRILARVPVQRRH
jgi:signal transduction histidine kinase